ncbi:MAG TPA: PilZ domain-containing protein [Spirochaetota bacterium]|nr:PilZ domain-containing protein [Spirochaetota bacterium]HPV40715.1 PilZ domain-containing protein [Spirochaetota bacterium]
MEKRNTIRVPFHVRSVIKHGDAVIEGDVKDLSTGGMLFETVGDIPLDEIVQISLFLYGTSSNLSLNISGRVVRKSDSGTAIKFTELDLDSFIHLRNIVSRNAFDEQKIIREFQEFKTEEASKD